MKQLSRLGIGTAQMSDANGLAELDTSSYCRDLHLPWQHRHPRSIPVSLEVCL